MIVDGSEFVKIEKIENFYDVEDKVLLQLTEFFKRKKQGVIYRVQECEFSQIFDLSREDTYRDFGIFISDNVNYVSLKYLLVLSQEDFEDQTALQAKIIGESEKYETTIFDACIVEVDIDEKNLAYYCEMLQQVLQNWESINFLNKSIRNFMYESRIDKKELTSEHLDVAKVLDGYSFWAHCGFAMDNYANIKKAYEEIRQLGNENSVLYYSGSSITHKLIFTNIAVLLLVKDNRKCEIPLNMQVEYFRALKALQGREHNYLSDYLQILLNPLEIGLKLIGDQTFVCCLDRGKLDEYVVTIKSVQVNFDCDRFAIRPENIVTPVTYSVEELELLPLHEISGLTIDSYREFSFNLYRMNQVLQQFEKLLLEKHLISEIESLDFTNVLLYRYNEEVFLGYISDIRAIAPYFVLQAGFGIPVPMDINLIYENLIDIRYLFDYKQVLQFFKAKRLVSGHNCFTEFKDHYRGLLLLSIPPMSVQFTSECNFTLEEIGIWSVQSTCCRCGNERKLLKLIPKQNLWEYFLSYYGGKHPSDSVTITIDERLWRKI